MNASSCGTSCALLFTIEIWNSIVESEEGWGKGQQTKLPKECTWNSSIFSKYIDKCEKELVWIYLARVFVKMIFRWRVNIWYLGGECHIWTTSLCPKTWWVEFERKVFMLKNSLVSIIWKISWIVFSIWWCPDFSEMLILNQKTFRIVLSWS